MTKIAILGLGAYEQHAKHLPFETDTIIANAIINNLKKRFYNFLFLPTQEIGYSPEHLFNKKSKTLSYENAIENIIKQAQIAKEQNINKIILINAHGGNSPIMAIAAMEIRIRLNMLCAYTSWLRFGISTDFISDIERHLDIHAGFIETSVMLHIAPHLVKMEYAKNFSNKQKEYIKKYNYLRAYGTHAFNWLMQDLNIEGACGNATNANKDIGKLIFEQSCDKLEQFIKEFQDLSV